MADSKQMSEGQRAYEARRAAKAGKSLDGWLDDKKKKVAQETAKQAPAAVKKPGLFSRLIDRAHKPLGK